MGSIYDSERTQKYLLLEIRFDFPLQWFHVNRKRHILSKYSKTTTTTKSNFTLFYLSVVLSSCKKMVIQLAVIVKNGKSFRQFSFKQNNFREQWSRAALRSIRSKKRKTSTFNKTLIIEACRPVMRRIYFEGLIQFHIWNHVLDEILHFAEAIDRRCSVKKVCLKTSQNEQKNTSVGACNFIKTETQAQVFSCKFRESF